jgi:hypothetical protein
MNPIGGPICLSERRTKGRGEARVASENRPRRRYLVSSNRWLGFTVTLKLT